MSLGFFLFLSDVENPENPAFVDCAKGTPWGFHGKPTSICYFNFGEEGFEPKSFVRGFFGNMFFFFNADRRLANW